MYCVHVQLLCTTLLMLLPCVNKHCVWQSYARGRIGSCMYAYMYV